LPGHVKRVLTQVTRYNPTQDNPTHRVTPCEQYKHQQANFTLNRIVALELNPVRGHFDAAHLCEIHRSGFRAIEQKSNIYQ
jgi:fido (protein-threonine AMPylation protein)